MPKKPENSADTNAKQPKKSPLEEAAGVFKSTNILAQYQTTNEFANLSTASKATRHMTDDARKKQALEKLLSAVAFGDEALAKKIVISRPELIKDSSATVTDISGKLIKGLTPLQAAICAGDVDMVQMIIEVLQQKLINDIQLSFDPASEMQRQFKEIYPEGIDVVEATQKAQAEEFKVTQLNELFNRINAASIEQVRFELDNPGEHADSELNAALHKFRTQFDATSKKEQIFNPFYLLAAFEFYDEQFANFASNDNQHWKRRDLFWRQVIGYIQRHLPACYLQAFAQGIYYIVENGEKLKRDFEFRHDNGAYMRADVADLNSLGYKWATPAPSGGWRRGGQRLGLFKIIANKKSGFVELIYPARPPKPTGCVIV